MFYSDLFLKSDRFNFHSARFSDSQTFLTHKTQIGIVGDNSAIFGNGIL